MFVVIMVVIWHVCIGLHDCGNDNAGSGSHVMVVVVVVVVDNKACISVLTMTMTMMTMAMAVVRGGSSGWNDDVDEWSTLQLG